MATFQTHITQLEATVAKHGSSTAIKFAQGSQGDVIYKSVSYQELWNDLEHAARYWTRELVKVGAKQGSAVGIWLKGTSYTDLVHILSIARASFIPQLISLRMTDPAVIYQLLEKSQAVGLIHDSSFNEILKGSPVPTFSAKDVSSEPDVQDVTLISVPKPSTSDEVVLMFHTSGSTSGIPKAVPLTASWMDFAVERGRHFGTLVPTTTSQLVSTSMGSLCHQGSALLFVESVARAGCFVLPTAIPYPISEMRQMIEECEVNRLNIFTPLMSRAFQEARDNPDFLKVLQRVEFFLVGGAPFDPADRAWATAQGFHLVDIFGSTEAGPHLMSVSSDEVPSFKPVHPSSRYKFLPSGTASDGGEPLYELIILPESPDCPVSSFRNTEDGHFHTGDLFSESAPGEYVSRGRNDDWIKMETALRCDTAAIENNVMETCGHDLVSAVIVFGAGRPSPAMAVELKDGVASDNSDLASVKAEILQRTTSFHRSRYEHERITDARLIIVVPAGTLPRTTKGNVRRKATEEMFKDEVDGVHLATAAA